MVTRDKDEAARFLADAHFRIEPSLSHIFRIVGTEGSEQRPDEPVKLLEVNDATIPSGIMPLQFAPDAAFGMPYSSVIVEVTPQEFEDIRNQSLLLPNGWTLGEEMCRNDSGASGVE